MKVYKSSTLCTISEGIWWCYICFQDNLHFYLHYNIRPIYINCIPSMFEVHLSFLPILILRGMQIGHFRGKVICLFWDWLYIFLYHILKI